MINRLRQAHQGHMGQALQEEEANPGAHVRNLSAEQERVARGHKEDVAREKTKADARKLHKELKDKETKLKRDIEINRQLRDAKRKLIKEKYGIRYEG